MLPLVTPPPTCQYCSQARGAKPVKYAVPPRCKVRRDVILPELKAILNDKLFWVDSRLRLPNNKRIATRYNADREKLFEDAERESEKLGVKVDNDQKPMGHENEVLEAAWKQLRKAAVHSNPATNVSKSKATDDAKGEITNTS